MMSICADFRVDRGADQYPLLPILTPATTFTRHRRSGGVVVVLTYTAIEMQRLTDKRLATTSGL